MVESIGYRVLPVLGDLLDYTDRLIKIMDERGLGGVIRELGSKLRRFVDPFQALQDVINRNVKETEGFADKLKQTGVNVVNFGSSILNLGAKVVGLNVNVGKLKTELDKTNDGLAEAYANTRAWSETLLQLDADQKRANYQKAVDIEQQRLANLEIAKSTASTKKASDAAKRASEATKKHADAVTALKESYDNAVQAVKDKRWQFFSPTFVNSYRDEQDKPLGPALLSVALTNRPFLRQGMPAIQLSNDTQFAYLCDNPHLTTLQGEAMNETLTKLKSLLGLKDTAGDTEILAAVKELKKPVKPVKTLSLTEQAESAGKILLDENTVTELHRKAEIGIKAAAELNDQKFELAYGKAAEQMRVDAKTETKQRWRTLYDLDSDTTLLTLSSLPKITATEPIGEGHTPPIAPDGVDQARYELSVRAKAYAKEHNVDFVTALDAVGQN